MDNCRRWGWGSNRDPEIGDLMCSEEEAKTSLLPEIRRSQVNFSLVTAFRIRGTAVLVGPRHKPVELAYPPSPQRARDALACSHTPEVSKMWAKLIFGPPSRPAGCPPPGQLVVHLFFRTTKIGVWGHVGFFLPTFGFGEFYGSGGVSRLVFWPPRFPATQKN